VLIRAAETVAGHSLAKAAALAGGELGIDSAAGRGTTIVARLPATAAGEP